MTNQIDSISTSQSLTEIERSIKNSIIELKAQIDSTAPCGELLVRIHKDLYEKPEVLGVLSDEEISVVIAGIKKHTNRELIVGKEKARLKKNFSLDDIDL